MFEQPLYETEPVAAPQIEGDLFNNYEIRNWNYSGRLYKILGMSALANILAVIILAQTPVLTMKGCDSPLVSGVCQVLDTVYVGSKLFGTDREYVDAVYERTDLGDAEITFVDVSGITPPLDYPAGYFQIANPEMAMLESGSVDDLANVTSGIPGIPSGIPYSSPNSGGSLTDTVPQYPQPRDNVVSGDLPTGFGNGASAGNPTAPTPNLRRNRRPRNGGRISVPKAQVVTDGTPEGDPVDEGGSTVAVQPSPKETPIKVEPLEPANPDAINSRPFADLGRYVNELIDKNQYRLDSQFMIAAKGKLNKDGKFDESTFKIVKAESSEESTINVMKTAIEAINDSGWLKFLKDLEGKSLNLTLNQDAAALNAVIESDIETEMRASSIQKNLQLALAIAKSSKIGPNADQNDKDDLLLLENAKVEVQGKKIILRFMAPKEVLLPMIQRKLAEEKAKPKQPNGTAILKPFNNTAQK